VILVVQDAADRGLVLVGGMGGDVAAGVAVAVELGKLLLETSSLTRCPGWNTLAVAHRFRLSSYGVPGSMSSGALGEFR
jgi:hypothetical protein